MKLINFLSTDGLQLEGILYNTNDIKKEKVILAIHGMTSNCLKKRDFEIAKKANQNGIDLFTFNNRGSEISKYVNRDINGNVKKEIFGMAYEDVLESDQDIIGAILKLKEMGYNKIYLQGHSLGCTKIVYTYNKMLDENKTDLLNLINGIVLLSLIDIPMAIKVYLKENFIKYLKYAEEKQIENKDMELMPEGSFIHPISVKTFLRYAKENKEIDFAKYGQDNKLEKLNNIKVPLFMRWGNQNEMIAQKADELSAMVNNIIKNPYKNIYYIDGANHSYEGKEKMLAKEIIDFIANIK